MMIRRKLFCLVLALCTVFANANPAQELKPRDLSRYEIGDRYELSWIAPGALEKLKLKAREYLWKQWQQQRLTYFLVADCLIYPEGCNDSVEYKIYIEPNEKGQWLIVIESERVVSAWMSGADKEQRSPYGRSFYTAIKKLAAGETSDCYSLFTERSEHPSRVPRLRLTSGAPGTDNASKSCVYF